MFTVSVIVVDDAIDLLFFDENSIQPYELGQSYRASMVQPASAESVIGGQEFHWKVPPSAFSKRWYMVLDNQAHDGDAGEGDQGGATSVVSASVTMLTQSYWTPFNDLVGVDVNAHTVLLSGEDLRLDEGTTVVLSAWALEFEGDVFLQTRAMYDQCTWSAALAFNSSREEHFIRCFLAILDLASPGFAGGRGTLARGGQHQHTARRR